MTVSLTKPSDYRTNILRLFPAGEPQPPHEVLDFVYAMWEEACANHPKLALGFGWIVEKTLSISIEEFNSLTNAKPVETLEALAEYLQDELCAGIIHTDHEAGLVWYFQG